MKRAEVELLEDRGHHESYVMQRSEDKGQHPVRNMLAVFLPSLPILGQALLIVTESPEIRLSILTKPIQSIRTCVLRG